jgi:fibronectin-binding autotransporter adhesin
MADCYRVATGNWNAANSWASSSGGAGGSASTPTAADNAIFDSNTPSGTHTISAAATCLDLRINKPSAGTCTIAGSSTLAISGSLLIQSATNITRTYTGDVTFNATTTGFQFQSNGLTWASNFTFNGAGGEWILQDALSTTGTITLTAGTFDANNFNVTCSALASNNSNTRTIKMGSGTWTCTGIGNFFNLTTVTNLTLTPSTSTLVSNGAGTRSPNFGSMAINNLAISSSGTITLSSAVVGGTLDFTGYTGQWQNNASTINGNVTLATGMTTEAGSSAVTLSPGSGATQTIDTKGISWNQPITVNAAGATVRVINNDLDLGAASTHTFTLTAGTFDLNGKTLSVGLFSSSNSNTRTLALGAGTVILGGTAGGSLWNLATTTGLTLTGASGSTIKITANSTSSKTFAGGGLTYGNIWIADANTGEMRLTGNNTFSDIKIDAGRSLYPTAGTTTHCTTFTASGTAGNLTTIASAAASTSTHALVKDGGGTISCDYLSIAHSAATPGSTWYAGVNSTNNNGVATAGSGWTFTAPPGAVKARYYFRQHIAGMY